MNRVIRTQGPLLRKLAVNEDANMFANPVLLVNQPKADAGELALQVFAQVLDGESLGLNFRPVACAGACNRAGAYALSAQSFEQLYRHRHVGVADIKVFDLSFDVQRSGEADLLELCDEALHADGALP